MRRMEGKKNPRVVGVNRWLLALVLVLLGVEVARGIGDLRMELRHSKHAAAQAASARPPVWPAGNEVPPEILAPRLLDDREDMQDYLDGFPKNKYRVVEVRGQGAFYIDDGKDEIKDVLRVGQMWEPELHEVIVRNIRPGSTVLDLGAHIGTHTIGMSKALGQQGRVYAFEPQRKLYRELVYNLQINGIHNVVPLRFAVGDVPAVIEMNPAATNNEGGTSIGAGGDKAEVRTIDSFAFRNVSFIKIDVETFEDHVLLGARHTIARDKPILLVEIQGDGNFDNARPELRAKIVHTISLIEQMGYFVRRLRVSDYLAFPRAEPAKAP